MAKVLRDLGRAGLVESVRGAGGGYRFCGNAKRTTLLDVVRLFEEVGAGPTSGIVHDTNAGVALSQVMDEIEEITHATLLSISIETMLKLMRKRRPEKTAVDRIVPRGLTACVDHHIHQKRPSDFSDGLFDFQNPEGFPRISFRWLRDRYSRRRHFQPFSQRVFSEQPFCADDGRPLAFLPWRARHRPPVQMPVPEPEL